MVNKMEASVLLETVDNYLIVGGRNCTYKNIKVAGKDVQDLGRNAVAVALKVFLDESLETILPPVFLNESLETPLPPLVDTPRKIGEDTLVLTSSLNYNEIVERWGSMENRYFDGLIRLDSRKYPRTGEINFDSFVEHESKNADKGLIDAIKAFKDSLDSRA